MKLRDYQQDAINATWHHLNNKITNPCIVIPTGGGKTPIMATILKTVAGDWGGRVIVLAHRKELLEQARQKIIDVDPNLDVGVYSASLKSRHKDNAIILGQIQSVHKRAFDLGRFDLVLVDEAHLIPPTGEGMYQNFLRDLNTGNPKVRIIGLTATPYRMNSGMICNDDSILNEISYEIGVRELIEQGYLCKLVSKMGQKLDTSTLHIRGGEFIAGETEEMMSQIVQSTIRDVIERAKDRKSILVFCSGINHAKLVRDELENNNERCELITGETLSTLRQKYINEFKRGEIKYLINVDVLTTGFDATNIDCVALLRPTLSPGLYYQMVGRGLRINPIKDDCLVLDYGNNIFRHGQLDKINIPEQRKKLTTSEREKKEYDDTLKVCPECQSVVDKSYDKCPDCGFLFGRKIKNTQEASEIDIISDGEPENRWWDVIDIEYKVHKKKGAIADHPKTMMAIYTCLPEGFEAEESTEETDDGFGPKGNLTVMAEQTFREWICIEHEGYARQIALKWWEIRTYADFPASASEAVEIAKRGVLSKAIAIQSVKTPSDKYPQIEMIEVEQFPDKLPEIIEETEKETELATPSYWDDGIEKWVEIDESECPF